jgi:hypothetical protein
LFPFSGKSPDGFVLVFGRQVLLTDGPAIFQQWLSVGLQLSAAPMGNDFCTVGRGEAGIRIGLRDAIYFSTDRSVLLRADGGASLEVAIVGL